MTTISQLDSPPRKFSIWVKCYIFFATPILVAAIVLTFAGYLFLYVPISNDSATIALNKSKMIPVNGVISSIERAKNRKRFRRSRRSRGPKGYKVCYQFKDQSGQKHRGCSGIRYGKGKDLQKGDIVSVEYLMGNASIYHLKGGNLSTLQILAAGVLTSLAGIFFILKLILLYRKKIEVLTHGRLENFILKSVQNTKQHANGQPIQIYYYQREGHPFKISFKTHQAISSVVDSTDQLIYSEKHPTYAYHPELLPKILRSSRSKKILSTQAQTEFSSDVKKRIFRVVALIAVVVTSVCGFFYYLWSTSG